MRPNGGVCAANGLTIAPPLVENRAENLQECAKWKRILGRSCRSIAS